MPAYRSPRAVPSLDGLRAIGVGVVIFAHLPRTGVAIYDALWQLNQATRFGYILLDSFFALSGFLITRLLLAEREASGRIDFGRFYVRRGLRILPIYYLTLAACIVAFRFGPAETAALATYTFNVYHPLVPLPNPMEHTWSLSVEEQFYLLWPLLISRMPVRLGTLVTGRIIPALGFASALLIAFCIPLRDNVLAGNLIYMLPCTRMVALSLGAWLAFREREGRPMPERAMAASMGVAMVALLIDKLGRDHGLIASQGVYWTVALVGYALFSAALIGALVFGTGRACRILQRCLEWSPFRRIGRASYGAYLYHLPVLYWFGLNDAAMAGGTAPIGRVCLAIAIVVALVTASSYLVEAPLLALKDRIGPAAARRRTLVSGGA